MSKLNIFRFLPLGLIAFASLAHSQTIWDEASNGDLSNDRLNPTNLSLALGTQTLKISTSSSDVDYFHIHLGSGMSVVALNLVTWSGTDQKGFMALQAGSTFTEPVSGTNVANLLGYSHFGPGAGNLGKDLLPFLAAGVGAKGFVPPLTGADYSFWLNQTSPFVETYQLDFQVVPEPCTMLALSGLAVVTLLRRKK